MMRELRWIVYIHIRKLTLSRIFIVDYTEAGVTYAIDDDDKNITLVEYSDRAVRMWCRNYYYASEMEGFFFFAVHDCGEPWGGRNTLILTVCVRYEWCDYVIIECNICEEY